MVDDKTSTGTTKKEKSSGLERAELFIDRCESSVAELYANLGLSWLDNYINRFFKFLGLG